jgi:nucleotide-binding universal stress UspA family protein
VVTLFKSIVVGTDGSPTAQKAVTQAAELAKAFDAKLHLVSAFRPSAGVTAGVSAVGIPAGQDEWQILARQAVEDHLTVTAAELRHDGLETEIHAQPTSPVEAILDVANSTASDLIVVGSKGMTGARRVLGSVPNSVAHRASCSVLIVKTT